ncbi:MAG: hypothetical protein KER_01854 [Kerstersia gyiorum]|uniref:DUF6776 family protein n=1 Tax=Kerstersia gyiorum TaxID=206506 RepID=UPI0030CEA70C
MPTSKRKPGKAHAPHAARHRARARRAPALAIVLALVLGLVTGVAGGWFWAQARPQSPVQGAGALLEPDEVLVRNMEELALLRSQLATRDGELAVERAARQRLEEQLTGLQRDLGAERDRLAFFEQLLPSGPGGSVDIRSASFERFGSALQYRVLLMRNGKFDAPFQGNLRFMATGLDNGKAATRELRPMQAEPGGQPVPDAPDDAAEHELRFDQYLSAKGVLWIPAGFVPESVTVQVLEGGAVKTAYRVELEAVAAP